MTRRRQRVFAMGGGLLGAVLLAFSMQWVWGIYIFYTATFPVDNPTTYSEATSELCEPFQPSKFRKWPEYRDVKKAEGEMCGRVFEMVGSEKSFYRLLVMSAVMTVGVFFGLGIAFGMLNTLFIGLVFRFVSALSFGMLVVAFMYYVIYTRNKQEYERMVDVTLKHKRNAWAKILPAQSSCTEETRAARVLLRWPSNVCPDVERYFFVSAREYTDQLYPTIGDRRNLAYDEFNP